jgi:hypothetical protein
VPSLKPVLDFGPDRYTWSMMVVFEVPKKYLIFEFLKIDQTFFRG